MLPDDAFLRRIPSCVDATQVVQLEAMVFSADAIEVSLGTIRHITTEFGENLGIASRSVDVNLFLHAWTIVDCLHVILQVLKGPHYPAPKLKAFCEKYKHASVLRNRMDHLVTNNAGNVAEANKRPPAFGALSYVYVPDRHVKQRGEQIVLTGAVAVTLTAGRTYGTSGRVSPINPAGRKVRIPVSAFRLEAFGESLDLEDAERDVQEMMAEINEKLEKQVFDAAAAIAEKENVPIEKILAVPAGRIFLCIELAFETQSGVTVGITE